MMKIGIVGATNVGKSTLFNAMIGSHRAIVTAVHGTTRDILSHQTVIPDVGTVMFLDSPGLDTFDAEIPYLRRVIDESEFIFFMIDGSVGFGAKEKHIYELILKSGMKARSCLIVNKLESSLQSGQEMTAIADYYHRGFSSVIPISAKQSLGLSQVYSFLKDIVKEFELAPSSSTKNNDSHIPLAFLGKPNAGKSTLLNALLGSDVAMVSEIPGTTLDYNVGNVHFHGSDYSLFDTAGIRKKGKIHGLERIAYEKTFSMLRYIRPMVVFLIDGDVGISHRDTTLLGEIIQLHLPVIVCVNKIDVLGSSIEKEKIRQVQIFLQFAKYIPVVGISGLKELGLTKLFDSINKVRAEYTKHIPTPDLNRTVRHAWLSRPPRFPKNKICKISYITQIDTKAPTFVVFVNNINRANFAFKRWVENTLRFAYGFVGVPIRVFWKNKSEKFKD